MAEMSDTQRQIIQQAAIDADACPVDVDAEPTHCCTLEAKNTIGGPVWIQVLAGSVNMHYPFANDPLERIRSCGIRMPVGLELLEWEASSFATFSVASISAGELAFFVDQLFTQVLGCDDAAYEPRAVIEELDS
jgi:hypothetical protein